MTQPSFRDVETLTAYLDGQLDSAQRQRLEARLGSDPELKAALDALRESRSVLRRLPQRRAPHNFTLTPKMAGIKPPLPRSYPIFRWASVVAAFLLFFAYATNLLPRLSLTMGAAAPAVSMEKGIGGGAPEDNTRNQSGGGCDTCTAEATPQALAPLAPSGEAPPSELTPTPAGTEQAFVQQAPPVEAPVLERPSFSFPAPTLWQVILFIVACLAGGVALIIRLAVERRWAKTHAVPSRISWRDVMLVVLALLLVAAALWGLLALASGFR